VIKNIHAFATLLGSLVISLTIYLSLLAYLDYQDDVKHESACRALWKNIESPQGLKMLMDPLLETFKYNIGDNAYEFKLNPLKKDLDGEVQHILEQIVMIEQKKAPGEQIPAPEFVSRTFDTSNPELKQAAEYYAKEFGVTLLECDATY
jgi:hypothetical protein